VVITAHVKTGMSVGQKKYESGDGSLFIVACFVRGRREVPDRFEQPSRVEPVHPVERREFDLLLRPPRPLPPNHLCLEQPNDGFGEGVVVRIAAAAD
jgi:hypothetical protein